MAMDVKTATILVGLNLLTGAALAGASFALRRFGKQVDDQGKRTQEYIRSVKDQYGIE